MRVKQRQDGIGCILQLPEIEDIITTEVFLVMIEKILDLLLVHALQCPQNVRVQILLRELLHRIEHPAHVHVIGLGRRNATDEKQ